MINKNKLVVDVSKGIARYYADLLKELGQDSAPDFQEYSVAVWNEISTRGLIDEVTTPAAAISCSNAISLVYDQYLNYNNDWYRFLNQITLRDLVAYGAADNLEELEELQAFPESYRGDIVSTLLTVITSGSELGAVHFHRLLRDDDINHHLDQEHTTPEAFTLLDRLTTLIKSLVILTPDYYTKNASSWLASPTYHYREAVTAVSTMLAMVEHMEHYYYTASVGDFIRYNNTWYYYNFLKRFAKRGDNE